MFWEEILIKIVISIMYIGAIGIALYIILVIHFSLNPDLLERAIRYRKAKELRQTDFDEDE